MKPFIKTFCVLTALLAVSTARGAVSDDDVRAARPTLESIFNQVLGYRGSMIGACAPNSAQEPVGPGAFDACFVVFIDPANLAAVQAVFPKGVFVQSIAVRFEKSVHLVPQ